MSSITNLDALDRVQCMLHEYAQLSIRADKLKAECLAYDTGIKRVETSHSASVTAASLEEEAAQLRWQLDSVEGRIAELEGLILDSMQGCPSEIEPLHS